MVKAYDKWEDLTPEERIEITKERFREVLKNKTVYQDEEGNYIIKENENGIQ